MLKMVRYIIFGTKFHTNALFKGECYQWSNAVMVSPIGRKRDFLKRIFRRVRIAANVRGMIQADRAFMKRFIIWLQNSPDEETIKALTGASKC